MRDVNIMVYRELRARPLLDIFHQMRPTKLCRESQPLILEILELDIALHHGNDQGIHFSKYIQQ
jgi:hypothetical protein